MRRTRFRGVAVAVARRRHAARLRGLRRQRLRRRRRRHRAAAAGPAALQILIGSSGDAETNGGARTPRRPGPTASGNTATVTPAQDIAQQLGQALRRRQPAGRVLRRRRPVRRLRERRRARAVRRQDRQPGRLLPEPAHHVHLRRQALLRAEGLLHAGAGDQHRPVDQGRADRRRHPDHLGPAHRGGAEAQGRRAITPLAIGDTRDRIGAFMVQAGGWIVSEDGKQATADTPENLAGAAATCRACSRTAWPSTPRQLDAGWGGEAFGKGKAAMTIEGNWIKGAMKNDFPDVEVHRARAARRPDRARAPCRSPTAGASPPRASTRSRRSSFVEAMTTADQQLAFAKAFGVMPSRPVGQGRRTPRSSRTTSRSSTAPSTPRAR